MLRLNSQITITQVPSTAFPNRTKSYSLNFVNEVEINSTWKNLTDTAKVIFPKNVFLIDENGKRISWQDKTIIAGPNPLVLRGDKIKIDLGYYYYEGGQEKLEMNEEFVGYIAKVVNRTPVEFHCEDNMYRLKQIQAPNKLYKGSLQSLMTELLKGTDLTVNGDATLDIGSFRTFNETVAQVLERLRKEIKIEAYFRGNELRCGGLAYYRADATEVNFEFQRNIIEDDLEYKRLDDIKIGAKAYSVNETEENGKKKKKRLQVFVTLDGETNETGWEGEKRTFHFFNITDKNELIRRAKDGIRKSYYEGFFGSFTAFGLPFCQHGRNVVLTNRALPELSGTYKCKSTTVKFGVEGFRRKIEVDIRVDSNNNGI